MEDCNQNVYFHIGEVRGKNGKKKGRLLFKVAVGAQGLTILLKPKVEDDMYCIPIHMLMEPFIAMSEEEYEKISSYFEEKKNDDTE